MSRIEFELAALRGRAPATVDVVDRVMARVATLPAPEAVPAVRSRRPLLIAASAAAVVAGAGMMAAWPATRGALASTLLEMLALARGIGGSSATVASLSRGAAGAFDIVGSIIRAIVTALAPLRPAANTVSLVLATITVATVILIVVRDVARAPVLEER